MEKLTKELDGFYRTPSGSSAVVPKMAAGTTLDGINWFEFRADAFSDVIRLEWPEGAPIALFDDSTARMLMRLGYGSQPSETMVDEFNALVDANGGASESKPAAPVATPAPALAPVVEQAAPPSEPVFPPDGWRVHPDNAGYYYKDQEVLTEAALRERIAQPA